MQRIIVFAELLVFLVVIVEAQNSNFYAEKPGACPPDQPVQICTRSCYVDSHCKDVGKCCPTSCGGSVCTIPVTAKKPPTVRPGLCPAVPTGRWVCSPTCTIDSDCRDPNKKCCRNRCGALACLKPDPEPVEPVDISNQPETNEDSDNTNFANVNPNNPFLFGSN